MPFHISCQIRGDLFCTNKIHMKRIIKICIVIQIDTPSCLFIIQIQIRILHFLHIGIQRTLIREARPRILIRCCYKKYIFSILFSRFYNILYILFSLIRKFKGSIFRIRESRRLYLRIHGCSDAQSLVLVFSHCQSVCPVIFGYFKNIFVIF